MEQIVQEHVSVCSFTDAPQDETRGALFETGHRTPKEAEHRRGLSKLCWGVFLFENLLADSSSQPPETAPPPAPILFEEADPIYFNLDVTGRMFAQGSPKPPIVPGVLCTACEAACLHYSVLMYNVKPHGIIGHDQDILKRREFFTRLSRLETSLPPRLRHNDNTALGTIFLKLYHNLVALAILRPLPPST
ncbi:hypothetical protein B0T16DRAFT_455674 [Cercophora newfieldiana]|uniref:Uncharacterized protein n=1 Tax=Cercophora newfieldiana TaxID=92897 RepID=A0AA39Y8U5_9PEZI|nr:hypothetical protein B0T16DRAFT_455674 [Cercophora newfieldiana]